MFNTEFIFRLEIRKIPKRSIPPYKVVVNEPFSFCIPTIIKCAPVYKKDIQLGLFKYVKSSVLEKNWSSETWTWSGSQSINGNKLYKLNQ